MEILSLILIHGDSFPNLNTCTHLYPILIHGDSIPYPNSWRGPYPENTAIPYLNTWGPHPPPPGDYHSLYYYCYNNFNRDFSMVDKIFCFPCLVHFRLNLLIIVKIVNLLIYLLIK